MSQWKSLSELYHLYITGNLEKKDLEGGIFRHLRDNSQRYRVFKKNRERWDEFISWLYPRIGRAIEMYREQGSSFEAYICGLVYGASREYLNRETNHRITEYVCWQAKAEDMKVCEAEREYTEDWRHISIPQGIKPRQILFLLLKSYYFVSDEYVKKVALAIGMDSREVLGMIEEIKKLRSEREDEIKNLRERLFCQYYRCLAYQKRLNIAAPGTAHHERTKDRHERARQRFLSMRKRFHGISRNVSNRMIAQVVGIPKGTVDSGFFALRDHLATAEKNSSATNRHEHNEL